MAFLGAPEYETNHENLFRKTLRVLAGVMQGKTNNTGSFTLTANSATTTVTLAAGRLGADTKIILTPESTNAATEFGAGTLLVSSRDVANNQFTVTHVNNAQANRTFGYVLIG